MKFTSEIEKQVYNDFLGIETSAYQEIIHYYEMNKSEIFKLPLEFKLLIDIRYAFSLYETEDYYSFLTKVDRLINVVIQENIYEIDEKDVFKELLYKKGIAAHKVLDYDKAEHIFSELVKIDKSNKSIDKAFVRNTIDKKRYEGKILNAISIVLFFVSATIIGMELLLIRTFYPEWTSLFEWTRNGLFLLGVFVLLFLEISIRYKTQRTLNSLKQKNGIL